MGDCGVNGRQSVEGVAGDSESLHWCGGSKNVVYGLTTNQLLSNLDLSFKCLVAVVAVVIVTYLSKNIFTH